MCVRARRTTRRTHTHAHNDTFGVVRLYLYVCVFICCVYHQEPHLHYYAACTHAYTFAGRADCCAGWACLAPSPLRPPSSVEQHASARRALLARHIILYTHNTHTRAHNYIQTDIMPMYTYIENMYRKPRTRIIIIIRSVVVVRPFLYVRARV